MPSAVVDIAGWEFWLAFLIAVVFLIPLRGDPWRVWVWAGVNLLFLRLLLSGMQFLSIAGALLAVFLLLRIVHVPFWRRTVAIAMAGVILALFLFHKLHGTGPAEAGHFTG